MVAATAGMDVCVAVPVYNGGRTIRSTLEDLLKQTFREFEILVFDDGSKDATPEIVSRLAARNSRIRLTVAERNGGRGAARNALLDAAGDRLLAWQDADDLWHERKLEEQIGFYNRAGQDTQDHLLASTYEMAMLDADEPVRLKTPPPVIDIRYICSEAYRNYHMQLQAMFGPARLWRSAGGFAPDLNWAEDLDLILGLLAGGATIAGHATAFPLARYNHSFKRTQPALIERSQMAVCDRHRAFAAEHGCDLHKVMALRNVRTVGHLYVERGKHRKGLEVALRALVHIDHRERQDLTRLPAIAGLMMRAMGVEETLDAQDEPKRQPN